MPSVTEPSKVLVTGASGYIAAVLVNVLLKRGHSVIGTVRSNSKGDYLRDLFQEYNDRFSYVIVEDLNKEGAFDEAIKSSNPDAVAHTAALVIASHAGDPNDLIEPAVNGTKGILESVKKYGPRVKRVVITSSVAAVMEPHDPPYVYTESDWNQASIDEVNEKGAAAGGMSKYRASKTLAERAAWQFVSDNKGQINFDVVTILPPYVIGPHIHEVSSAGSLNLSLKVLYDGIKNPPFEQQGFTKYLFNWVDVRDLAEAHALAFETEKAGGERLIISAGAVSWQDIYDALNVAPGFKNVPVGIPGSGKGIIHPAVHSAEKAKNLLGLKLRSLDETVRDTATDFISRGWQW